jgi:hypothetical protein
MTQNNTTTHIFIASISAFLILNSIENILHYNIGRTTDNDEIFIATVPTKKDCLRIFCIMIIFAILQGLLTLFFNKYIS